MKNELVVAWLSCASLIAVGCDGSSRGGAAGEADGGRGGSSAASGAGAGGAGGHVGSTAEPLCSVKAQTDGTKL
ncbi:MAG TPA: hypothetical protein VHM19_15465, partial [Polyangiales bacterium]|nr:hypothetical protein [Polyangiales bacterium]